MAKKGTSQVKTYKRKQGAVARLLVEIDKSQLAMFTRWAEEAGLTLKQAVGMLVQMQLNSLPQKARAKLLKVVQNELLPLPDPQPSTRPPYVKKVRSLPWVKVWVEKILFGTTASLPDTEQLIWFKLMMATGFLNCRDGILRYGEGQPIPRDAIAKTIGVSRKKLDNAIEVFKNERSRKGELPRLQEWEDGTLVLTNFAPYQESEKDKKGKGENNAAADPETQAERELREDYLGRRWCKSNPKKAKEALVEHQEAQDRLKEHKKRIDGIYAKAQKT